MLVSPKFIPNFFFLRLLFSGYLIWVWSFHTSSDLNEVMSFLIWCNNFWPMKRVTELNSQKPWPGVVISSKMNSAIRGQIDQQLLLFNSLELRPLNQPTNQIMMEAPSLMTHTRNLCIIESNMVHLLWVLE